MPIPLRSLLGDLMSVNHRLTRVAARAAGGAESPALWRTLSALAASGPIRLGDLADLSRIAQPTATKLVGNLTQRGWTARLADPADARATQISITSAGAGALADWRDELAGAMLPLFADIAVLQQAVNIIRDRVDAATERGLAAPAQVRS